MQFRQNLFECRSLTSQEAIQNAFNLSPVNSSVGVLE